MSVPVTRLTLAASVLLACVLAACALTGCGAGPASPPPASKPGSSAAVPVIVTKNTASLRPGNTASLRPGNTASPRPASTEAPRPASTEAPRPASTEAPRPAPQPRVSITRVRARDGALVTVATFLGPVRYVLHDGSADPGPVAGLRAGPAVTGAERTGLLAAFNGGFKLSAGAGGYLQEGHLISPLRRGLASLVIDRSGQARMGVWGRGVPAPGEAVYSVRQNLVPLVLDGRPTAASAEWTLWGATLGGGADVARSAVGQDAAGHLIYAASMSAVPADLASVLASHGARIAMELDINPEWVQLDVARRPGGPLTAEVPGQARPADQYLLGWARDFFTVLA